MLLTSLMVIVSVLWWAYCEPPLDVLLMIKYSMNKEQFHELGNLALECKGSKFTSSDQVIEGSSKKSKRVVELMKQLGISTVINTDDPSPEVFLEAFSIGFLDWDEEKGYFHSRYRVDRLVRSTDWSKIAGYQYRYLDDGWYVYYYRYE